MITRLVELRVFRDGAVYRASGRLSPNAALGGVGTNIVGFGVAGHLTASCIAAAHGKPVALLRPAPKLHGSMQQLDGVWQQGAACSVYCSENDQERCLRECERHGLQRFEIVTVEVTAAMGPLTLGARPPTAAPVELRACVNVLHGTFTLSSGAVASRYYETIPAASRFDVACALWQRHGAALSAGSQPIGVAYGGTYLAVVAALLAGRCPTIWDPTDDTLPRESLTGPLMLVEDYVTSGRTVGRIKAALGAEDARYLSLFAPAGFRVDPRQGEVACLLGASDAVRDENGRAEHDEQPSRVVE